MVIEGSALDLAKTDAYSTQSITIPSPKALACCRYVHGQNDLLGMPRRH